MEWIEIDYDNPKTWPEKYQEVLAWSKYDYYKVVTFGGPEYKGPHWTDGGNFWAITCFTHWMALPKAPAVNLIPYVAKTDSINFIVD